MIFVTDLKKMIYGVSIKFFPDYKLLLQENYVEYKTKLNSVALVRERTVPTERPPPVGEVSANFCG